MQNATTTFIVPQPQKVTIIYLPIVFLAVFFPVDIYFICRSRYRSIPWNTLSVAKIILTLVLCSVNCVVLAAEPHSTVEWLKLVCYGVVVGLAVAHRIKGIRSSSLVLIFWLLSLISAGLTRLFLPMPNSGNRIEEVKILLLVVLVILFSLADRRPEYQNIDEKSLGREHSNQSPEMTASAGNKMLFLWFFRLTYLSCRDQLDEQRIWSLDPEMKCDYFVEEFTYAVTQLVKDSELSPRMLKVSFFFTIVKTFGELVLVASIQRLFLIVGFFVCPFILRELIDYAKTGGAYQLGLYYSLILCAVSYLIAILNGQYTYNNKKFAMQTWSALVSTVFKKAMRINDHAISKGDQKNDVGVIINLLMNDADKFGQLCMILNTAWSTVVIIVAASFLLWTVLGWSFLAGLAVIIGVIVTNYFLVKRLEVLQKNKMFLKDRRIKLTDEILEGIKILKYYGWEQCFQKHLTVIRINEIDALRTIGYINLVKYVVWILAPFMISLVSFATYVWSQPTEPLTVEKAFVSITLFNIIRFPLTSMPATITQITELWVSTARIIGFLQAEDYALRKGIVFAGDVVATIKNGTFGWTDHKPVLQDVNITVRKSQLLAVCGKVASGKSSLVAALLGDINCMSGEVRLSGSVAYVPQEPWIQHNTVRNNILFGQQMNKEFYSRIIDACELREDLDALPNGDATEIGERGINLSGGQKQRIALARAIYRQADIYLLDDPLSAVDYQVGRRIFDQSIGPNGLLKGKVRVLVTHDIHAVQAAAEVYELKACGLLRRLDAKEPLISLDGLAGETQTSIDSSFIEKTELKSKVMKQQFQRVENLVGKEHLSHGINVFNNLLFYIAKLRYFRFVTICLLAMSYHGLAVWANFWLSTWASDEMNNRHWYLTIYFVFGIGQGIALVLLGWITLKGGIQASKCLHNAMLTKILKVPLAFFSENPSGRILNRFAQDVDKVDVILPTSVRDGVMACISVLSVFILFILTNLNFTFAVLLLLAIVACLFLLWLHLSTSKLLKRLTLITQSPIVSHVKESLNGKSTIRAFDTTAKFIDELEAKIDHHQKFNYLFAASQCWQMVWLELIGATIITIVTLFVTLADRDDMSSAKVGLVLTYALSFIQQLQALFLRTADIETNTVAVERIKEYTQLHIEESRDEEGERPEDWPSNGRIEFKKFSMTYRRDFLDVLKDINLTIEGGQKVGIIGRTGAGKSSLISALIRMVKDTKGSISIDGHDIGRISLQYLRQQITIVPQDSVLFTETLRFNLDPTSKHGDEELIDIIEKCRLKPLLERNGSTLSFLIDGKNNNLSVGEKQMICLARALLRKSKIMIFDEATSSVDDNNEYQLQQVIEQDLRDCTVLTIAHRLDNVKDNDCIVVIDNGAVTECDKPENLLKNENSYFHKSLHR